MDADVIVVGAGCVGASTAKHLAEAGVDVVVVDKEPGPARHQSGRNSGVIHPGFNYDPDSTRAGFAVEGARRLTAYCRDNDVPVQIDGILVVALDEAEVDTLHELKRRADANGVEAEIVGQDRIEEIEDEAAGIAALHAPTGGSVDGAAYTRQLVADAETAGATVAFSTKVRRMRSTADGVQVDTSRGRFEAKAAVNCAGLHADRLADVADVRVVPFRGYYAELVPDRRDLVRSHVYPTPDLEMPFLGVHLSRRTDGRVIVGPGAMLAFGREAYELHQVDLTDMVSTMTWPGFWKLLKKPAIRGLIREEVEKSLSLAAIRREAAELVPALSEGDLVRSFAGNRAQLVDRDGNLLKDVDVRTQGRIVHVLNAVSPGLTASLVFGQELAETAIEQL